MTPLLLRLAIFYASALVSVQSFSALINKPSQKPLSNLYSSKSSSSSLTRRDVFDGIMVASIVFGLPPGAGAAVTDETESFANTQVDSSYRGLNTPAADPVKSSTTKATSDEVVISIPKSDLSASNGGLGLELGQAEFRTNVRVFVKNVTPGSLAEKLGIRRQFVVVSVNGKTTERTNVEGVAMMVSKAAKDTASDGIIQIKFRDPAVFQTALGNLDGGEASTQVAPAGDTTQRNTDGSVKAGKQVTEQNEQRLTVSQLIPPKLCNRGATTDDLLEISYLGTVVNTGDVFDGSAIKINGEGVPGRGNDVSLFFVLGKQPFGQFPPGWDVGLEGMSSPPRHTA